VGSVTHAPRLLVLVVVFVILLFIFPLVFLILLFFGLVTARPAIARNVDLSTVPKRNTVQLTIYNSEDLTLVRETRSVTFKKGVNPLQFSWANTLIDPTLTINEFGLAVSPVMEVLSPGAPGGRVHFAIPVSMELRRAPFRAYGSAGYFTRGLGWLGSRLQTGQLNTYAFAVVIGVLLLLGFAVL